MTREFTLPDVGEGIVEAELVTWLVSVGDAVSEDQPVVELETDKSLVELPSPVDGVVASRHAAEGDLVAVGDVLVTFEEPDGTADSEEERASDAGQNVSPEAGAPGDDRGSSSASRGSCSIVPPNVRRVAQEHGLAIDEIDGTGPGGRITEDDVLRAVDEDDDQKGDAVEEPSSEAAATETWEGESAQVRTRPDPAGQATADRERTLTTPVVRRIAAELDVDLDDIPAVGHRNGNAYVTEQAVREFARQRSDQTAPASASDDRDGYHRTTASSTEERVPYRGLRRTIGQQMERSLYTAPHVTRHQLVDATALIEIQDELAAVAEDSHDLTLTFLPFVMKAVTAGLMEFPYLNSSLDESKEEIALQYEYNLGVATATEAGLMVPVVDDVDQKGILQIATELDKLALKARERTIERDELRGSTFTITNIGPIGGYFGTPIINYPEAAILAMGEIKRRPWVRDDEIVAAYTLPLSLSYDHRLIDGATAARFMNAVMDRLRNPDLILLE